MKDGWEQDRKVEPEIGTQIWQLFATMMRSSEIATAQ